MDQFILTGDGTSLCYEDHGEGEAIVFVHGFPFAKSSWQPQIEELKKDYRVIVYDQRGFGRSEPGYQPLSMTLLADDLHFLLDALTIPSPVICGLSMGGYVAMNFITRFPERVRGLVLANTQCLADDPDARKGRESNIELIRTGQRKQFEEKFLSKLFASDTPSAHPEVVQNIRVLISHTKDDVLMSSLKALAERESTCELLLDVKTPALLIGGEEDHIIPATRLQEMNSMFEHSVLHMIPHAGHLSNLEQAEIFNKHIKQFITGLK